MPIIEIEVKNKIAKSPAEYIVCGNSDYQIKFAFDEEWAEYKTKTARFTYNGKREDVIFDGDVCSVPIIRNANICKVGVFAGNLHTTTPALVTCRKSILCAEGVPDEPMPDVYAQMMEKLNNLFTEDESIALLIENDMLPAVHDENGAILTDEKGNIVLRY